MGKLATQEPGGGGGPIESAGRKGGVSGPRLGRKHPTGIDTRPVSLTNGDCPKLSGGRSFNPFS